MYFMHSGTPRTSIELNVVIFLTLQEFLFTEIVSRRYFNSESISRYVGVIMLLDISFVL